MSADNLPPAKTEGSDSAHDTANRSEDRRDESQWRPVGFRAATSTAAADSAKTRPVRATAKKLRTQPIPTRPKGRIFTGLMILALIAVPCYSLWSNYFRYPARGVVRGHIVRVSPPWQGTVETLHVREGDEVAQGQPIMTLKRLELEHQLDAAHDELRVAQAELKAQAAQLIWQAELRGDRSYKACGEYYEAWGKLMHERALLDEATAERARQEAARQQHELAVSDRQLENARFSEAGQRAKVEKLEESVRQLQQRAEIYEKREADVAAQMNPQLTAIETLQSRLARLRERVSESVVRSPVNGRVIRLLRFAGEAADPMKPAIEIVEDGSLEVTLYLPQRYVTNLQVDNEIEVTIEPNDRTVTCVVERRGRQLEAAPAHIERHYAHNARLLPVMAKPKQSLEHIYLGSEVKLSWQSFFHPRRESSSDENVTVATQNTDATSPDSAREDIAQPTDYAS
jgi:multidrug resistance efflux pump